MEIQDEAHNMQIIKGKRTKRPRQASPITLTMAATSSSTTELDGRVSQNSGGPTTTSSAAISVHSNQEEEDQDMANCLILLAQGQNCNLPLSTMPTNKAVAGVFLYQCKTCDRCFPSFQALGGHRASHKKPKASLVLVREDEVEIDNSGVLSLQIPHRGSLCNVNKFRIHECMICGAEFSSGQALGGHMRRHRTVSMVKDYEEVKINSTSGLGLDLNLPAPEDDHRESKFAFASKKQVIVFSASSLVDCHY
ncbi:zinc finger protein ZAT5-like [Actinidia eriantha]|uniref:zinc finger protein ZAT5-like n=1 Tax=Actinidia eriantha TaxID=165200 RepID=UPI00258B30F9|nr:zinc finger protein ZAT5-like [Actinidia eriantha]